MFELLLVVIGVLALIMLLLIGRSRRSSGDPSSSVQDFTRALTAMEPGGAGRGDAESSRDDQPARDAEPAEAAAEDAPDGRDRSSR